jgi:hypothetical protein
MVVFPLRSTSVSLLTIIIVVLTATPRTALPYEIGPYPKKKVHETLTLMASDCLQRAPRLTGPSICLPSPASVMGNDDFKSTSVRLEGLGVVSGKELADAVRWPDDPTREVGVRGISKFLVKMFWRQCEKNYTRGMKDGLLCSSHHGPLQFWHAMASKDDELTTETQSKMLAWAEFLYKVVVGEVNLSDDYCDYWTKPNLNAEGRYDLARALAPDGQFPCPKEKSPWKIGTLFSMTCKNPFSSGVCDVSPDQRVARINALGALLHLVQDSYAQGHAARGLAETNESGKRIKAKYECLPISQFYTYGKQDGDKHGEADAPPEPGHSCAKLPTAAHELTAPGRTRLPTIIDDPILASANVLWLVEHEKRAAELIDYLNDRVFWLARHHQPRAAAGGCFEKQRSLRRCPASK